MNRLEKVLSVFMILTLVTFWGSLSVSAQSGSQAVPYFPDLDAESSGSQSPSPQPPSSKASLPSKPASSSSASSTSKPSSKAVKKTGNQGTPSQALSSGEESGSAAGEMISSLVPSSEISLPSVASVSETDPLDSVVTHQESSHWLNWIGLLSWGCIALGVIVVLIVVFSNRRPPRGMGRKRYRRPKRSRKKKLLNDKYYRNINRY
ncbi:MAG: hypothetical protein LKJ17_08485 [Oscillospiraceae bacterium]|jgi:hypothetical protein|nr:hypothetical protein [Oscillospiraceae bacterium]